MIYIHPKFSQMNLASGAGNPGWSRTQPKLVCCEAWWFRSNNDPLSLLTQLALNYENGKHDSALYTDQSQGG